MDIRTILVCLLVVNFFLSIFMVMSIKTQKIYPGYIDWVLSVIFLFFTYVFFALRGIIPDFFTVIVANSLVSVAGLLRIMGINKFFNRSTPRVFYTAPFGIFVLLFYLNFTGTTPIINYMIVSTCIIFIATYIAYVYWKFIEVGSLLLFGATILIALFYPIITAARLTYWYFNPGEAMLLNSTFQNNIFFLISIGLDILGATLFFAMNAFRLTAELENKNIELEKINITKDKFFSIIAHDLQGPVGNISQYLDQVITDYGTYSEEKKLFVLDRLSLSIKKTFHLLVNLLEWAKDQTGMISFTPVELSLADAVEETINVYRSAAYNKKITLINAIPTELTVIADRHMLVTVLRNLLSNALKFSNEGDSIEIIAEEKDGFIKITFSDQGIGFSDKDISSLLKIDGFISSIGTANESGSGLGLIICKEFIEKHGGELYIKPKEKGCDVIFTLPN